MTDAPPEELYGLQTLTANLTPPETRVKDAESARSIGKRLVKDDEPRAQQRALTKGLLDGNPPYSKSKIATGGQWQANLNFMEGEAAVDSARVPYYQLFSGVEEYATCRTKWMEEDPQAQDRASKIISKHFHKLLSSWEQFDWHMQNAQAEMLRWGYAPLVFDQGGSWKFKSMDSKCVLVPKDAASCVDERLPYVLIVEAFTVTELWDKIRDEATAESAGWNVRAVKRAIQQAGVSGGDASTPWSATSWEEWQRRLKNNDLYYSSGGNMIYCYRLLVKEFRSGKKSKISQFIVTHGGVFDERAQEEKSADAGFLFRHIDRYESYSEALVVSFQNTGDGTFHSVRGMAMKGFKHWAASNRLKCKALDNAFQRSSIVLSSDTVKSQDQMQLIVRNDMTMLPPGTKVEQMGFAGDIEGVMAVDRMVSNHLANNLGVYNQRTLSREDGRGEQPTATQVQMQVQKEATLSQGQITLYYQTLDLLYAMIFRKAVKSSEEDAVEFRKWCEDDGVPESALKDVCVKANRQSGYGSSAMRQLVLQQLQQILPMLPEEGKQAYLDMAISATAGVDKIDVLNPRNHIPDQDESMAAVENGTIAAGSPAIVSSGQNHVVHLQVHVDDVERRTGPIREAMEQEEPVDPQALTTAYQYLQLMGGHMEEHLAPLEADPSRRQLAKQFRDTLQLYVAFHGKLRGAIITARREAQVQAQQEQNASALGELDQAKVRSMELAGQLKVDKWNTDKAIKLDKADVATRLQTFKTQHSSALADASTAANIRRENMKAA